ncbi:MAG: hypothetical protein GX484_17350 [Chloroflexi bacterium]|nr:hypothetical protein [Chloroflexota bacterium]
METQKPTQRTSPWVWVAAALAVLVVIACLCIAVVGVGVGIFGIASVFNTPSVVQVTAVAVAQPVPTLPHSYDPTPLSTPEPAASLPPLTPDIEAFSAELPPRDRYELARRFLGIEEAPTPEPVTYQIGDVTTFWVSNDDLEQTVQVQAELAYANDVVYMWVEVGVPYDLNALRRSADRFAQETFPTNRSFFYDDDSWLPGIDSDPRLHILHSVELGSGIAGYFYSPSAYPAGIVPYSNEKEMFFINIGNTPPGSDYYDAVLAHEFQHMLHWAADPNEESWLGEGLSELAAYLNGFGPSGFAPFYLLDPDIQLTNWPEGGSSGANYGAGYLFTAYFLDRFGQDALQALVANPLNGLEGVDDTLESLGLDTTADEVFADWTVANYLRDPSVGDGRYSYEGMFEQMAVGVHEVVKREPYESGWQSVNQYGVDYIEIIGPGEVTLSFEGTRQVRVIPANTANTDGDPATDDQVVWWSNRGDDSHMTLARMVDLSGVERAVLEYDVWYQIETLWDFAYVTVSTDGGQTWDILETPYTTPEDPHGNSYGPGYTGRSADHPDANAEGWLHEAIDLSAYAGQEIMIGFEMLTDDAVNQPGLAIDNICIEAIDWCDDLEGDLEGWEAAGFVAHSNALPQRFSVQVIVTPPGEGTQVLRVPLDEENRGELTFTIGDRPAVLVVSGLTRHTTEPAQYRYTLTPGG